jgi:predicted kinase
MPKLIITRGLPGSGKSTKARAWVAEDPTGRARINRDDLRKSMHGGVYLGRDTEVQITTAQHAAIRALLRRGICVVCDDTNLPSRVVRELRRLATTAGSEFEVWDLTDVPPEVCIQRDALRDRTVGSDVIRGMHQRYIAGKPYPLPIADEPDDSTVAEPYVPQVGAATAIMVDIDGTVALMGDRSPYPGCDGEDRCGEDSPNRPVIDVVLALYASGHEVIFCSGRTEACREQTEQWLLKHVGVQYVALYMRAIGDQRKDSIVKTELFDQHIRKFWHVVAAIDDRRQVVDAWRSLGLTVLQVADGDF